MLTYLYPSAAKPVETRASAVTQKPNKNHQKSILKKKKKKNFFQEDLDFESLEFII